MRTGAILWYTIIMEYAEGLSWVSGPGTDTKTYITRVINLGTWEEWQALKSSVAREEILDAVKNPIRGQWTKKGKAFAETVFDCIIPNDALISYD